LVARNSEGEAGQLSYIAVTNQKFRSDIPMQERDITHSGVKKGTIHIYGFSQDALGTLPIETNEDALLEYMEQDETLPPEWFRICEYVSLFPHTENLSLYVDSIAGIRGLSFGFGLEACYLGLKESTIYTGDSSPLYDFLPTDGISV